MKILRIPKGHGKFRTIYAPSAKEKAKYRALLPELERAERAAAIALGVEDVAHGFVAGRSPVTCARAHIGYACTVSVDLESWFDSVMTSQVQRGLYGLFSGRILTHDRAKELCEAVCVDGAPRQGLPTSPVACNIAAVHLDRKILDALTALDLRPLTVYTRYADDLTVSLTSSWVDGSDIVELLTRCAGEMGWTIATRKTSIQYACAGRRRVVGLSVGEHDVCAPRQVRRKLRAAVHQDVKSASAKGLAEWCAVKLPKQLRLRNIVTGPMGNPGGCAPQNGGRQIWTG